MLCNKHIEVAKIKINKKNNAWLKILLLLIIVGGLTLLLYKTGLIHFFLNREKLRGFLDSLGPLAFIGFIFLQAVQVVAAPIPGEATGLMGGYLYGPYLGVFLSTMGLTIGSYIAFILSRIFGRPVVERFVDPSTIKRFDYLLHHKGAFFVFLLFLIPGLPKDYLCYILGLGHLTTTEFLIISGTGRLFGTILLTLSGSYIRNNQYGRFFILLGIAIIVVIFVMAYKDKMERWLRLLHIRDYRRKRTKKNNKL